MGGVGGRGGQRQKRLSVRHDFGLGAGVGIGKNEIVPDTISLQRQAGTNSFLPQAVWVGLGAGVGKGKNDLVSDTIAWQRQAGTNSFLPQAVWVGLGAGVGKGKSELVSDTNSFFASGQRQAGVWLGSNTPAILAQRTCYI